MKDHLLAQVAAVAIAASAIMAAPQTSWSQAAKSPAAEPSTQAAPPPDAGEKNESGIVVSVSGSAIISAQGMSAGGEIWAEWYSLPPGRTVVEPTSAAKWAYLEVALDGSAAVTANSSAMCRYFDAAGREAPGSDPVVEPGDVEACTYSILQGARRENRDSQPYVFATLSVGGPWKRGMEDGADQYVKVNGLAKGGHILPPQFGEVEKEILKTGAMRAAIRRVTMPPGSRIVTTDRYPTLRMVEKGRLNVIAAPEGSGIQASKVLAAFDITEWAPANADKQIVLSNTGNVPVQFVEWSVAPAQASSP